MRNIWCLFLFIFLVTIPFLSFAAKGDRGVKEGNQLYKEDKFQEALKKYDQAHSLAPNSDIINFNRAAALYKTSQFQEAAQGYTNVLVTDDPELEAKANYNIGNSKYKEGELNESTDLNEAVNLYTEALNYYRRAIELNEKDTDAKYNYEFLEKKIKQLTSDRKQQQQPQSKAQQKDKQEKKQKEKGEKEDQPEEAKEEEPQPPQEPGQMSEEEARMLLEGHSQEELGKITSKKSDRVYPKVLKDW